MSENGKKYPNPSPLAQRVVDAILNDIHDRRGLRQAWESVAEDVQAEIVAEWWSLIVAQIDVDQQVAEEDRDEAEQPELAVVQGPPGAAGVLNDRLLDVVSVGRAALEG